MPRAKKLTEEQLQAKRVKDALNSEAVSDAVTEERQKLPEYIATDPLLQRRIVKRGKLGKYQEQMLLLFMPELTAMFFKQLRAGVKRGERDAMQMFAHMCGFVEKKGGVNIITNIQQNRIEANGGGEKTGFQFDRIVRQLAEAAKPHGTPLPPAPKDAIVDAEALQAGE